MGKLSKFSKTFLAIAFATFFSFTSSVDVARAEGNVSFWTGTSQGGGSGASGGYVGDNDFLQVKIMTPSEAKSNYDSAVAQFGEPSPSKMFTKSYNQASNYPIYSYMSKFTLDGVTYTAPSRDRKEFLDKCFNESEWVAISTRNMYPVSGSQQAKSYFTQAEYIKNIKPGNGKLGQGHAPWGRPANKIGQLRSLEYSDLGRRAKKEIMAQGSFSFHMACSFQFKKKDLERKIKIKKVWQEDRAKYRPSSLSIDLYREVVGEPGTKEKIKTVTLKGPKWEEEVVVKEVYDKEKKSYPKYIYSVSEDNDPNIKNIKEKYTMMKLRSGENNFTLVNRLKEDPEDKIWKEQCKPTKEKTSVSVKKMWVGDNGNSEYTRTGIQVSLYQNGKIYATATLGANQADSVTWRGLPVEDENCKKYDYTVQESGSPEGYTMTKSKNGERSFVITNTYKRKIQTKRTYKKCPPYDPNKKEWSDWKTGENKEKEIKGISEYKAVISPVQPKGFESLDAEDRAEWKRTHQTQRTEIKKTEFGKMLDEFIKKGKIKKLEDDSYYASKGELSSIIDNLKAAKERDEKKIFGKKSSDDKPKPDIDIVMSDENREGLLKGGAFTYTMRVKEVGIKLKTEEEYRYEIRCKDEPYEVTETEPDSRCIEYDDEEVDFFGFPLCKEWEDYEREVTVTKYRQKWYEDKTSKQVRTKTSSVKQEIINEEALDKTEDSFFKPYISYQIINVVCNVDSFKMHVLGPAKIIKENEMSIMARTDLKYDEIDYTWTQANLDMDLFYGGDCSGRFNCSAKKEFSLEQSDAKNNKRMEKPTKTDKGDLYGAQSEDDNSSKFQFFRDGQRHNVRMDIWTLVFNNSDKQSGLDKDISLATNFLKRKEKELDIYEKMLMSRSKDVYPSVKTVIKKHEDEVELMKDALNKARAVRGADPQTIYNARKELNDTFKTQMPKVMERTDLAIWKDSTPDPLSTNLAIYYEGASSPIDWRKAKKDSNGYVISEPKENNKLETSAMWASEGISDKFKLGQPVKIRTRYMYAPSIVSQTMYTANFDQDKSTYPNDTFIMRMECPAIYNKDEDVDGPFKPTVRQKVKEDSVKPSDYGDVTTDESQDQFMYDLTINFVKSSKE